jgi:hypothetical protein
MRPEAGDAAEPSNAVSHVAVMPLTSAEVVSDLTCPLCLDIPGDIIHQCTNGHIFCAGCLTAYRERIDHQAEEERPALAIIKWRQCHIKCPTCRVGLGDVAIRNRIAEMAVGLLPGPCKGCGTQMLRKDLAEHERMCDEVSVPCPFPGCTIAVRRKDLAEHQQTAAAHHLALEEGARQREQKAFEHWWPAALDVKVELRAEFKVNGERPGERHVLPPPPPPSTLPLKPFERIDGQAAFQQATQFIVSSHPYSRLSEAATTVKFTYSSSQSILRRTLDFSKTPHELLLRDGAHIFVEVSTPSPMLPMPPRIPGDAVTLKVVTQAGDEIYFKCKQDTKLEKLMAAFCNRQGLSLPRVRFLFDGQRIRPEDTPRMLEMEDGDVIDAILEDPH